MGVDIYKTKSTNLNNYYTSIVVKTSQTGTYVSDQIGSVPTGTFHTVVNDRFLNAPPYSGSIHV